MLPEKMPPEPGDPRNSCFCGVNSCCCCCCSCCCCCCCCWCDAPALRNPALLELPRRPANPLTPTPLLNPTLMLLLLGLLVSPTPLLGDADGIANGAGSGRPTSNPTRAPGNPPPTGVGKAPSGNCSFLPVLLTTDGKSLATCGVSGTNALKGRAGEGPPLFATNPSPARSPPDPKPPNP